jgi:hypothetical protein
MKSKRVLAAIISLLAVFSLVACKSSKKTNDAQADTTAYNNVVNETATEIITETNVVSDTSGAYVVQESSQPIQVTTVSAETTEQVTDTPVDDPTVWSTERIVEEYKNAARRSHSTAKSTQSISLKNISVNNGEHENVMSFVGGIIGKFLESNSTVKDGITGGFESLVPQDVSSARAYKNGNDTVIELYLAEQTSGPKEDANSGSVGHGITAVGDIAVVVNDLSARGLPLELSEDETKVYYTNPSIKVTINENGEIVSGTWFYTVEIKMDNFKAFGQNVNTASIVMDNMITI